VSDLVEALRIVTSSSLAEVQRIAKDLIKEFFPEVPFPRFKIVNHTNSKWYGRAEIKIHRDTFKKTPTIIKIQKSIMHDENALKAIIAHELIHHWQYETADLEEVLRRGKHWSEDIIGHGDRFIEMAANINAVYGKDFVTEKSDLMDVTHQTEYFLIIRPSKSKKGDFWSNMMVRPSKKQKEKLKSLIEKEEAHVVKTQDKVFVNAAPLKVRGGKVATFPDPEHQARLKELYEGPNVNNKFLED